MTAPFPHHYEVRLDGRGDATAVLRAEGRPEIVGGAPPEFGGEAGSWSPEHLLLSALALCLKTTFDSFLARARLAVSGYESRVAATLDKTEAGLVFTAIVVEVEVKAAEADHPRLEQLLQSAKKHCIVSNALRAPVELRARVLAP